MNFPWRTALFVSLAVNLIVVSAAVGALVSGARLHRPGPPPEMGAQARFAGQRAFFRALPQDARDEMREHLRSEIEAMRTEREAIRAARQQLYEAARAEPYDAARVRTAFAAVRAADEAAAARFQGALADAFGRVSAEERRAALDAMIRGRQGGGPGGPSPVREDAPPGASPDASAPALTPEEMQQRRQERRERFRERVRERREQQQTPAP